MKFNSLVPELYISDYNKSLAFYLDILEFKIEYQRTDPEFALLSYGEAQLMIQQQKVADKPTGVLEYPYGRGINFQIETPDIQTLVERLRRSNYPLRRGIEESWRKAGDIMVNEIEIHLLDPDGYFLRFSQFIASKQI